MTAQIDSRANKKSLNGVSAFIQKQGKNLIPPLIAIALFLLIWQVLCSSPTSNLPSPLKVIKDTWDPFIINPFFDNGATDKGLGWQIINSLGRVGLGFSLAAIVGISVGIVVGANDFLYRAVDPIFQVLRTVPPLAWLPISLAALKAANPSAIFVIFITSVWPIIINTVVGVQQLPQDYRNVARVLRLSSSKYFFKILFPATVPYIFTGLRIGVGLSWLAIVAAEMLVGGVGIGSFIWNTYNTTTETNLSEIILALLYVGLVGLLLDRIVAFIASKIVPEEQK